MIMGRNRRHTACVAVVTCLATVSAVTWLFSLTASHQKAAEILSQPRNQLRAVDQLQSSYLPSHDTSKQQKSEADLLRRAVVDGQNTEELGQQKQQRSAAYDDTPEAEVASQLAEELNDTRNVQNCQGRPNTDYHWGEVVVWGERNLKDSAEACCKSCHEAQDDGSEQALNCNVWVWCGDKERCGRQYKQCWLKHLVRLPPLADILSGKCIHFSAKRPRTGKDVAWTSGLVGAAIEEEESYKCGIECTTFCVVAGQVGDSFSMMQKQNGDRTYHVAVTAQGQPTHWQIRIHYYWYKKMQRECRKQGVCHMGGWTRILHSGKPDDLMNEIPTHVVQPLMDKDDKGYVVLNRPWAFVQWLRDATIPEKFVLMSEPDHLFMKPMPNMMIGDRPAAFPFFYIEPATAKNIPLVERFAGKLSRKQLESIPPIGNAPTLMQHSALKDIASLWMNVSHAIFDDEEAHKEWNWVMEMYGFAITTFIAGIKTASLHLNMMCQPPWDTGLPERPDGPEHYILHYTYGMDFTLEGVHTPGKFGEWRFDKRTWGYSILPMNLGAPPKGTQNYYVRRMIDMFNEATSVIPGWSEYQKNSVATQWWDGKTFKDD